jgi:ABC-type Na+ efflux pump permease subunit
MESIRALVWKDLQVHWRGAGLLLLVWPLAVRLLALIPSTSQGFDKGTLPTIVTTISLLLVVAVSAGLATMLVERERSKETFAWLRSLPVSDAHIVAGKCVTGLAFHLVGFATWWLVLRSLAPPLTVLQAITVWNVTGVIASVALASRIASSGRLAPAAPLAILVLGLLAGPALGRWQGTSARALGAWNGFWEHPLIWITCLALHALLGAVAYWRFHACETHVLAE